MLSSPFWDAEPVLIIVVGRFFRSFSQIFGNHQELLYQLWDSKLLTQTCAHTPCSKKGCGYHIPISGYNMSGCPFLYPKACWWNSVFLAVFRFRIWWLPHIVVMKKPIEKKPFTLVGSYFFVWFSWRPMPMLETLWEQSDAFERWSKKVELGFGQPNVWKMGAPSIFHGSVVGCLISKIGSCDKKDWLGVI